MTKQQEEAVFKDLTKEFLERTGVKKMILALDQSTNITGVRCF